MTVNVTSGGTERAAEPILERQVEVVANAREDAGSWNAGNRNVGIGSDDRIDAFVRR
jgi:hypothetical protein